MFTVFNKDQLNDKIIDGSKIVNELNLEGSLSMVDKLYSTDKTGGVPNSSLNMNSGITLLSTSGISLSSGSKYLYIKSDGKIGIGTNTPDTGYDVTIQGNTFINGNLDVIGAINYKSSEVIPVTDNFFLLNSDFTANATEDAGLEIERGTYANSKIYWSESNNYWVITSPGDNATAPTAYRVVDQNYGDGRYLLLTGGTVSGNLTISSTNKLYLNSTSFYINSDATNLNVSTNNTGRLMVSATSILEWNSTTITANKNINIADKKITINGIAVSTQAETIPAYSSGSNLHMYLKDGLYIHNSISGNGNIRFYAANDGNYYDIANDGTTLSITGSTTGNDFAFKNSTGTLLSVSSAGAITSLSDITSGRYIHVGSSTIGSTNGTRLGNYSTGSTLAYNYNGAFLVASAEDWNKSAGIKANATNLSYDIGTGDKLGHGIANSLTNGIRLLNKTEVQGDLTVSTNGELKISTDNYGLTFSSDGARVYKKTAGGLRLKPNSDSYGVTITDVTDADVLVIKKDSIAYDALLYHGKRVWNEGNDGVGSGLDADLFQGNAPSYFATSTHNHAGTYEPVLTKGNLTESTSSVLTITGGTAAIIGSGATIQVKQASGAQNGYLSSTDWTTFNNKQSALTNPVTGTGTSGQFAQFNGTSTITGVTAKTAFNVDFETTATNIKMDGTQSLGSLGTVARADHIHPTDTSRAAAAHGHTQLDALGNYVWLASNLPTTYSNGLAVSFVQGSDGWASYGTVITAKGYVSGGATLQLYTPYSATYGGGRLKWRAGDYGTNGGNSWTSWNDIANFSDISWTNLSGKPTTLSGYSIAATDITAQLITGYSAVSGTISATDSILTALNKLGYDKHVAVTMGTANGLSLSGQALSLSLAGAGSTGALSSTDWTTFNNKANTASPTFTGTPISTTAAADTNTTQIATTAFVLGQASSVAPIIDGTATVGTSLRYARQDHIHPTDTSRQAALGFTPVNKAGDTMTGNLIVPNLTVSMADDFKAKALVTVGIADYCDVVILLHEIYNAAYVAENACIGTIFASRGGVSNGNRKVGIKVHTGSGYNGIIGSIESFSEKSKLVTCTYNGVKYMAIKLAYAASYIANGFFFEGFHESSGADALTAIAYYNNNTATVINSEINSSIVDYTSYANKWEDYGSVTFSGNLNMSALTASTVLTLDASKNLASSSVTTTELGYLSGATSSVQTQLNARAPLASPALTGTPTAPTAAADTNTTQLATTAFVVGQASASSPSMNGVATIGTSLKFARADHIHPVDTSRAPLAAPTFTGVPAAPTAAVNTNTTQLATTAFVLGQVATATPNMNGTGAVGTSTLFARQDHVHPTDTTRAPLASPTFTGIATLPANSVSDSLLVSLNATISATGTTQGTATALTKDVNIVTTVASGTGVVVQGATTGKIVIVVNKGANALNVYPASGHSFDSLSANTPISIPVGGFLEIYGYSTTQWTTTLNAIVNWSMIQGKPTSLTGYGILDGVNTSDVVTVATPNKILKLDSNGMFATNITGNSDTANRLATPRTISFTGDFTGSSGFDGSMDVPITATLANVGTAGTYTKVTTDAKGRITSGSNPTTIAGYNISDAYIKTDINTFLYEMLGNSTYTGGTVTTSPTVAYSASIASGTHYIKGVRYTLSTGTVSLVTGTNYIYIDDTGVYRSALNLPGGDYVPLASIFVPAYMLNMNPPSAPTLAYVSTGGQVAAGTYYVAYNWENASGQTIAGPHSSITIPSGTTNTITFTIPAFPVGITKANVYVSTTSTAKKTIVFPAFTTTAGGTYNLIGTLGDGTNPVDYTMADIRNKSVQARVGAGSLGIASSPTSSAFKVTNSTTALDTFSVDGYGNLTVKNGGGFSLYTDDGTTAGFTIDGATGDTNILGSLSALGTIYAGDFIPASGELHANTLKSDLSTQVWFGSSLYGLSLDNSDIVGLNNLIFNDECAAGEGLFFPKTGKAGSTIATDYDEVRALDGSLYFNSVAVTKSGGTTGPYIGVNNTASNNGYGLSLYGGPSSTMPTYGLAFQGTATFGVHGSVSADWATYFTMNNTANRGWIFRNQTGAVNVASISNAGDANFNGVVTATSFTGKLTTARTINGTSFDGSANITVPSNVIADATNATRYVGFVAGTSGNYTLLTDTGLTYNPSTNILGASISGNAATATGFSFDQNVKTTSQPTFAGLSVNGAVSATSVTSSLAVVAPSLNSAGADLSTASQLIGDYAAKTTANKMIWTIGSTWNTWATHYGLAYEYITVADSASQHALTFRSAGATKAKISLSSGHGEFVNMKLTGSLKLTQALPAISTSGTGWMGFGLRGATDAGFIDTANATILASSDSSWMKINTYYNGTSDVSMGAGKATELWIDPDILGPKFRVSSSTPTAGGQTITWGATNYLVNSSNMYGLTLMGSPHTYVQLSASDGTGNWGINIWASDERLKYDIKPTETKALDKIMEIEHVSFKYKQNNKEVKNGYIAQKMEQIDEEFVLKVKQNENSEIDEKYQINEQSIIPTITKAMQEMKEIIDEKDKKIDEQENKINKQNNIMEMMLKRIEELERKIK